MSLAPESFAPSLPRSGCTQGGKQSIATLNRRCSGQSTNGLKKKTKDKAQHPAEIRRNNITEL